VYSLIKRDRQSLFQRINIATDPHKLRRPRFSFFSYAIVKEQTISQNLTVKKTNPNPKVQIQKPAFR
jgi:hypothetical protein